MTAQNFVDIFQDVCILSLAVAMGFMVRAGFNMTRTMKNVLDTIENYRGSRFK